ncbi:MAG: 3'(2'),5'-bisphosphate nucleotidase CysQ [Candidatus Riflebacteria bacterium]|nr:3'(2'),5'-bisphosphate nucleotidase CysQ [Candidatus Riflebacteria bacterium]
MSTPSIHPDLAFVVGVVLSAGEEILRIYRSGFDVSYKKGEEPVTQADQAADRLIVSALLERFPTDATLSEEQGLRNWCPGEDQRTWFIDPIDGTKEFIKRNGEFAIQVGLAREGRLELAVVLQPTTPCLFVAAKGKGCFRQSGDGGWARIVIPPRTGPPVLALSRSHPSRLAQDVVARLGSGGILQRGGVGLKLMAIAGGEAHFYVNDSNSTKAWDIAGPELLFTEAGGEVSDLLGHPFTYDPKHPLHHHGLLASADKALHQAILQSIPR